jgi:hypothetical protein
MIIACCCAGDFKTGGSRREVNWSTKWLFVEPCSCKRTPDTLLCSGSPVYDAGRPSACLLSMSVNLKVQFLRAQCVTWTLLTWFSIFSSSNLQQLLRTTVLLITSTRKCFVAGSPWSYCLSYTCLPPMWPSCQSSWLQIRWPQVQFPALPDFLRSNGSEMGSAQPREYNWGATWKK